MLSNTATPKYYGKFRDDVLSGKIRICREIEMEMNRIDALIENPGVWYDDEAVEGYIDYCENELTLTDGGDLVLLDSFKLWAEQTLCWFYYVEISVYKPYRNRRGGRYVRVRRKKRLINKLFLIVGRGGSKSLFASTIQSYFLNIDKDTTKQIVTAPTMKQAEETISPIQTAITRSKGPLFSFLTEGSLQNTTGSRVKRVKLASTKKGIENFLTGSLIEIRPMSIDKLQGLRVKLSTVDEWLSGAIREDPIGAIEQGASKLDNYLIIATSSEGTVRGGPGDGIKMELMSILKGDYDNPHVAIFWYKLDDIKEVGDPDCWEKANPNIGKTVSYETYQRDVEKAERVPSARNDILAKRFGIPTEGYTYYFTYEETIPTKKPQNFDGMLCSMGMDASQGDDFYAFTFEFPLGDGWFGLKTRCYVSERKVKRLNKVMYEKYMDFVEEGSLEVLKGADLDPMEVYEDLDRFLEDHEYDITSFGYDPYNAKSFVERWEREHGSYGIEKVIQGAKTESVPLGKMKHIAEDGKLVFDQKLMSFGMGNAITIEDTNGNRKLLKRRYDEKIDPVSGWMDAHVAYELYRENFE